jgi:copper chaperone CopZ
MREFKVNGMTRGHCEAAVQRALQSLPGVRAVNAVDRVRGIAVIEGVADDVSVTAAIKAEGYEASAI